MVEADTGLMSDRVDGKEESFPGNAVIVEEHFASGKRSLWQKVELPGPAVELGLF